MSPGAIAVIAYGILAIVGGVLGYIKAKSKPSLLSGLISGILLIFSGIAYIQGAAWGRILAMLLIFLLVDIFAWRLIKTRKFMPAGLMILAGIAAFVIMLPG